MEFEGESVVSEGEEPLGGAPDRAAEVQEGVCDNVDFFSPPSAA